MAIINNDRSADDAAERTPLLDHRGEPGSSRSTTTTTTTPARRPWRRRTISIASIASVNVPKAHHPSTIVAIMLVLVAVASSAGGFFSIAMTRILEDRFCEEYYSSIRSNAEPIDEDMCKVDVVQSRLAYLLAISTSLEAALGCLLAMPWGFIADR
jgi:hypothetical protein